MNFRQLKLKAFGHFTDAELDFSGSNAGLHIIYGDNEAGKSTSLRALGCFLFGIPQQSADTFLHQGKGLRIGATLENAKGEQISLWRRKGRKNTLLNADNEAVAETSLEPFLGAVDETLFSAMFGLNHETLRRGAKDLLEGEGRLSESLSGAGSGTATTRRVLAALRDNADELYTEKGRGRKRINRQIGELREARAQVSKSSTTAQNYLEKQRVHEPASAELAELKKKRDQVESEEGRLARLLRTLPAAAKLQGLKARREQLGEVPVLPPDVSEWRNEATQKREEAAQEMALFESELSRDRTRLSVLVACPAFEELESQLSDELSERLGQLRKANRDLPKRLGELGALKGEAERLLATLHPGLPLAKAASVLLTRSAEQSLRRLSERQTRYETATSERRTQLAEAQSVVVNQKKTLMRHARSADLGGLRRALGRAQQQVTSAEKAAQLKKSADRLQVQVDRSCHAMGRFAGNPEELSGQAWPDEAIVQDFERRQSAQEQRRDRLSDELDTLAREKIALSQELNVLAAVGDVPQVEQLGLLRASRDAALSQIAAEGADVASGVVQLRAQIIQADSYADRLRNEASQVAQDSHLRACLETNDKHQLRLKVALSALTEQLALLHKEWAKMWRVLGSEPGNPVEMRSWLLRLHELLRLQEQRDTARQEARQWEGALADVDKELSGVLEAMGESGRTLWEPLAQRIERAQLFCTSSERSAELRRQQEQRLRQAEADADDCQRRFTALEDEHQLWRADWHKGLKAVGLTRDASAGDVEGVLERISELSGKLKETTTLAGQVENMQRDAHVLESDLENVLSKTLPELQAKPTEEAIELLVRAHRKSLLDAQTRVRITADAQQHEDALARARNNHERAVARLAALAKLAQAADQEELILVEARVAEARELERQQREVADEIVEQSEGESLEAVLEQMAELDADAARKRLADVRAEKNSLATAIEEVVQCRTIALEQVQSINAGANIAAEELAERIAQLKLSVREYLRYRLGAALLSREVERYRDAHQGPVLGQASELSGVLTSGRYIALKIGYDKKDEQMVLCVLQDGREVEVDKLSDGTRDQLYLAFRLASLEHYMKGRESIPLILDDVLIHFDDDRSKAALRVLGELAKHHQVLFFIHHARLVELAQQTVPSGALCLHRLG